MPHFKPSEWKRPEYKLEDTVTHVNRHTRPTDMVFTLWISCMEYVEMRTQIWIISGVIIC